MAAKLAALLLDCLGFRDPFNLSHFAASTGKRAKQRPAMWFR
jgi:hypothetical protein